MKKALVAIGIGVAISVAVLMLNSAIANSAINVQCKSQSETRQWGFWPGWQRVTDHTTWCYGLKPVVGKPNVYTKVITSISHTVVGGVPEVGALCDVTGTKHWNISGSLSNTFAITWEDEGDFKCATNIPGFFVNRSDTMKIWVSASGKYCGPDYCPCATNNNCSR